MSADGEGWNGGTALWEDMAECPGNSTSLASNCTDPRVSNCAWPADSFPSGLKKFRKTVGVDKTIWAHAGLWTSGSPYRAKYAFASGAEGEETPPQGPGMWNHVFSSNREWGLSTIKQDHIRQQVAATKSSYAAPSVGVIHILPFAVLRCV